MILIMDRNNGDEEEDERDIKRDCRGKEVCTSRWRSNPIQNFIV
jgi:hypothetical protein